MKKLMKLSFLLLLALGILMGCSKDDPTPPVENVNLKVNKFIYEVMSDIYLWYDRLPNIDYEEETDPKAYFDKLLYVDDKWSYITDDIEKLENSFEGKEKSYGWSLAFGRFSNTGDIFAIVEFVYPNTPAAEAKVERGDLIVEMNGASITDDNYTDLLGGENINVTFGILGNDGIATGSSIDIVARDLELNPVVINSVVEHDGHKIGYMFYTQYIDNYTGAIDTALQSLLDQEITDLVIDLRYNRGGSIGAAVHLCSSLAPLDVVNANNTLVKFYWNNKYMEYFTDNQVMHQLEVYMDKEVPVKMGLDKIHFLIGPSTASASELTITGLKPYMSSVTTVGETTYGKYTASITLKPEDFYDSPEYYASFDNWGIQPIVIRYANSAGVTDFKDGFAPNIEVEEDLFATLPLGTKEEPLFKAAIEDITGSAVMAQKSVKKVDIPYTIFDRGFSKYDKNKREVLVDFEWLK